MNPDSPENAEIARLKRRGERERAARFEAEAIAERATRELYDKQSRLQLLEAMAVASNLAVSVEEALRTAVNRICEYSGWSIGHVLLLDERGPSPALASARIWHLSNSKRFEGFRAVSEQMTFPAGVGLPGRVLKSRRAAWIVDVHTDTNFPRARLVKDIGFNSGFAFPILVETKVAGVLEFFCEQVQEPNEEMLDIMTNVGAQLGRVIERQRARESLLRREEFFRRITENASDIITIIDRDGFVRYGSPSLQPLLGYAPAEYEGRRLVDFVHLDDALPVLQVLNEGYSKKAKSRTITFRFCQKNGSWRTLEGMWTDLLDDPVVAGIIFNCRDVTERKKLEEQFLQSQKMQAVGQLAGGVAHDFNNILTAILGYNDFMLRRLPAGERLHREAMEIKKAADRAAALTRQLLTFSRKQVLNPRIIDLNSIVSDIESMLRRLVGENIRLVCELDPRLGSVKADAGQLEQVMVNLVVNARDAMPNGGNLIVSTQNTILDEDYAQWHPDVVPGNYVMLSVSDNGIGMSREVKSRLFEPFFTTKEAGRGTGLGLATSLGIVKQSGGHISVYSEVGQGTSVKVHLPRVQESADRSAQADEFQDHPSGNELVLLVEDDDMVREVGACVLVELGYKVLQVAHGMDAVEILLENPEVRLVISDVVMPHMGGKSLMNEVSKIAPHAKVILTSGYTDGALTHDGTLEPGIHFLPKPYTVATLSRKIREALDS